MGLLNTDKHVKLTLDKLSYLPGEVVKGSVNFDFGLEKLKIDKIIVTFREKNDTQISSYSEGYSSSRKISYRNILTKTLARNGEYNVGNYPFQFLIPRNILPRRNNITGILKKLKIKGILANIIELLFNIFVSNRAIPTYEIIARLDIPWGLDITDRVVIDIYENQEQIENEKELLTTIAKEEGIYTEENEQKIESIGKKGESN